MVKVDLKAFNDKLDAFEKKLGEGLIADIDSGDLLSQKRIAFSSPGLNYLFGSGGINYTRIFQIYGPEHSGKTSLVTAMVADLQRNLPKIIPGKKIVLYVDFEKTFDVYYAKRLGLNTDKDHFILLQSTCGEEAFEVVYSLIETGALAAVVLDSDAAMPVRSEETDAAGKVTVGTQAKLLASVVRRMNALCARYETPYFVISQERVKIGAWSPNGQPVKESTGGDVVRFYASVRNRIKKIETLYDPNTKEAIGIKIQVKNIKNKQGTGKDPNSYSVPWRVVEMNLTFNGFDYDSEYLDLILKIIDDLPFIEHPSRVMYNIPKYNCSCRGKDAFLEWLKAHPKEFEEVKREVDKVMAGQMYSDRNNEEVPEDSDGIPSGNVITLPEEEDEQVDPAALAKQALENAQKK